MMSVLGIVTQALDEMGLPVPASIISTTDDGQRQCKAILMAAARSLRSRRIWPQLKKRHTFNTVENQKLYALPADYYCALLGTQWDEARNSRLLAVSDAEMTDRTIGSSGSATEIAYRIFGPDLVGEGDTGNFQIDPDGPATAVALSFEYLSLNMFMTAEKDATLEILTADDDLCVFDDDLMVAEFKWRYLKAKEHEYAQEQSDAEQMIDKAMGRLNGPFIGSFEGKSRGPRYSVPNGSWSF